MRVVFMAAAGVLALALAGCDAGPSATSKAPANPPASISAAGKADQTGQSGQNSQSASADPRDAPAPLAEDGKPIWAANKKHSAQENADYQFGKNWQHPQKA